MTWREFYKKIFNNYRYDSKIGSIGVGNDLYCYKGGKIKKRIIIENQEIDITVLDLASYDDMYDFVLLLKRLEYLSNKYTVS